MNIYMTDVNNLKIRMDTKFHLPQYEDVVKNLIFNDAVMLEEYIDKIYSRPLTELQCNEEILISNSGEGTVGKVAIDDGNPVITPISKDVIRVKLKDINPYYVLLFFHTKYGQTQIKKYEYGSSGITHIGQYNIKKIYIPQIDTQIQEEIECIYKSITNSGFDYKGVKKHFKLPNMSVKDTEAYKKFCDEVLKLEKLIDDRFV